MAIIIIDGPEKTGKSTLVAALVELYQDRKVATRVRKWGPVSPDDRVYSGPLREDSGFNGVMIWDRSWASEHVYGKLLGRDRRLVENPWLGEWLHGRAVMANGLRVMHLGTPVESLAKLRDPSDLPVNPYDEAWEFTKYADRFGWTVVDRKTRDNGPDFSALFVMAELERVLSSGVPGAARPPLYCGPRDARVIFVGERLSSAKGAVPGAWLPFTSRMTSKYGEILGDFALRCGWTNAHGCSPQILRGAEIVVSCGGEASTWVKYYVLQGHGNPAHLILPHPSWLYRWNTPRTLDVRTRTEDQIKNLAIIYGGAS